MEFSILDAALANVVLKRTRDRNTKRLSPSSYAYHPQKNVFDAILALMNFDAGGKLFAVLIDFEKYFDLIPTGYLQERLEDGGKINLTIHEKHIFNRFLRHCYCDYKDYLKGMYLRRHKGTPQGSSVPLLLANIANNELDTALAAEAGKFVRFADDVVALCRTYEQAQLLERCFMTIAQTVVSRLMKKSRKVLRSSLEVSKSSAATRTLIIWVTGLAKRALAFLIRLLHESNRLYPAWSIST